MSYEASDIECVGVWFERPIETHAEALVRARRSRVQRAAPQIAYVDEVDVAPGVRCDELGEETFLAAELAVARNLDERMRLLRSILRILGFQSLAYMTVSLDERGRIERAYVFRNALSSNLLGRMLHTGFLERSACLRAVLEGHVPQRWDLKTLMGADRTSEFAEQDRKLVDEMRQDGLCSGLACSLPISGTSMRSLFICTSPRDAAADWFTEGILIQFLTLALSLHQRCAASMRAVQRRESLGTLSPLHQQIVGLLALGLSDKEIALRLNMTVYNVDYHLRQIKERYGASNRSHLAFIVGSQGLGDR